MWTAARRGAFAILTSAAFGCSGQLVVDLNGASCSSDLECGGGTCVRGTCLGGTDGSDSGDRDGGNNGNGNVNPDDPKLDIGEVCALAADCESGMCVEFNGVFICTQACTGECPNGLVCFDALCTPSDYCESDNGIGNGPGCTGSACLECLDTEQCSSASGAFACECREGFKRVEGVCEPDPCFPNPCENDGFCQTVTGVEGAVCACADTDGDSIPDFIGQFCEDPIVRCPADAAENPCENGGTCVDRLSGFACECPPGFEGRNCEVFTNECDPNPCLNGSTCVDLVNGFDCECVGSFLGDRCEVPITGDNCTDFNPCENGICIDNGQVVRCECQDSGFSGDLCGVNIDDCADSPCQNGGTCIDGINGYVCDCPLGFDGDDCEILAPCTLDVDCGPGQYCDNTNCAPDACDQSAPRTCDGDNVVQCAANGSALEVLFTCGDRRTSNNTLAFDGACVEPSTGDAYCRCEDDWDCPQFTECNVDRCVGTGQEPSCRLPSEEFSNVLPTNEIRWGSEEGVANDDSRLAPVGTPFREFTQVIMTPTVANLTDDNGDGLIDERDFPEIIFLAMCWPIDGQRNFSEFRRDGVLRVIHGGGPEKGQDHLAICGNKVWRDDGTGVSINTECGCEINDDGAPRGDSEPNLNSTMAPAVADLDGDGLPEIIVQDEATNPRILVFDYRGNLLATSRQTEFSGANNEGDVDSGGITVANIDNDGPAEIVLGRNVFGLEIDGLIWRFTDYFTGPADGPVGDSGVLGPVSCLADLDGGDELEIVIGGALYRLPVPPAGYTFQSDCTGGETDEAAAYCDGELVEIWSTGRDGYCAVADVFGANGTPAGPDNPLDGNPEIILVGDGAADNNGGRVTVIDPNRVGDKVVREYDYRGGTDGLPNLGNNGGPPNVDDFDGDGFPEMGVAFQQGYAVTDFQDPVGSACSRWTSRLNYNVDAPGTNTPREPGEVTGGCTMDSQCSDQTPGTACNEETGRCVCLHNSWVRQTEDQSSRSTGSSVFDFNGDGAAEVIYNDECQFRIYDGLDGTVLFEEFSESRTRVEYPVVADVDNDGNAEIVFGASNESGFCSFGEDSEYNAGLEVWGDAGDFWVSARRMWNQHAYHVTNITENASVPRYEPKGWLSSETNGRDYNSYRSNPRTFGVAPDLRVAAVQVASGSGCGGGGGAGASIVSEIGNIGDLRVGPEVVVGYEGDFGGGYETLLNSGGDALVAVLENTLEPRDAVFLTTAYDASWNGESVLPARVRVSVDVSFDSAAGTVVFDNGRERECVDSDALESNNALEFEVASTEPAADLVVRSVQANSCGADGFSPTVNVIVDNVGVETAPGALVRLYAGDPNQGGTAIGEAVFPEDIAADGSVTVSIAPEDFPFCVSVQLFAAVDPENAITECNDGNNLRAQEGRLFCCVGQGG